MCSVKGKQKVSNFAQWCQTKCAWKMITIKITEMFLFCTLKGGSHLTFEQLSPQVQDMVSHIREVTYNSMHDVISTVHMLLALDPKVIEMLTEYSPSDLRCLVEARSRLEIQAMEIISVSVRHLVNLKSTAAGGDGDNADVPHGEKRRAPPPWGRSKHGQEKRPRY